MAISAIPGVAMPPHVAGSGVDAVAPGAVGCGPAQ
jgi:hypothetical protein